MKTNKSYTKRLKATRGGKLIARTPGQDHFNAKEPGEKSLRRKRTVQFDMKKKDKSRFLPNA